MKKIWQRWKTSAQYDVFQIITSYILPLRFGNVGKHLHNTISFISLQCIFCFFTKIPSDVGTQKQQSSSNASSNLMARTSKMTAALSKIRSKLARRFTSPESVGKKQVVLFGWQLQHRILLFVAKSAHSAS